MINSFKLHQLLFLWFLLFCVNFGKLEILQCYLLILPQLFLIRQRLFHFRSLMINLVKIFFFITAPVRRMATQFLRWAFLLISLRIVYFRFFGQQEGIKLMWFPFMGSNAFEEIVEGWVGFLRNNRFRLRYGDLFFRGNFLQHWISLYWWNFPLNYLCRFAFQLLQRDEFFRSLLLRFFAKKALFRLTERKFDLR